MELGAGSARMGEGETVRMETGDRKRREGDERNG
jgi:hypothetical protein